MFDDGFEDLNDFSGSERGSKAVFDDSLEDRSDVGGFAGWFQVTEARRAPRPHAKTIR